MGPEKQEGNLGANRQEKGLTNWKTKQNTQFDLPLRTKKTVFATMLVRWWKHRTSEELTVKLKPDTGESCENCG